MKRTTFLTALAAVAAVTLAACTGTATQSASSQTQSTSPEAAQPSAAASESKAPPAEPSARVGDCFSTDKSFELTNVPEPVACEKGKYTEQTIAVYDLPETLALTYPERQELADAAEAGTTLTPAQEADIKTFATQTASLYDKCTADVRSSVGQHANRVSLFGHDLTGPNQAQWDAGERWARCNVAVRLPADAKRAEPRLMPLPVQLSNAANLYTYQSCYDGSGKKFSVHLCDSPLFPDGAWMKGLEGLPISSVGKYPGTEAKAEKALERSCLAVTKPFVQASADLTTKNIVLSATAPNWTSKKSPTLTDVWADPDGVYGCTFPNWAYIAAPPV